MRSCIRQALCTTLEHKDQWSLHQEHAKGRPEGTIARIALPCDVLKLPPVAGHKLSELDGHLVHLLIPGLARLCARRQLSSLSAQVHAAAGGAGQEGARGVRNLVSGLHAGVWLWGRLPRRLSLLRRPLGDACRLSGPQGQLQGQA